MSFTARIIAVRSALAVPTPRHPQDQRSPITAPTATTRSRRPIGKEDVRFVAAMADPMRRRHGATGAANTVQPQRKDATSLTETHGRARFAGEVDDRKAGSGQALRAAILLLGNLEAHVAGAELHRPAPGEQPVAASEHLSFPIDGVG